MKKITYTLFLLFLCTNTAFAAHILLVKDSEADHINLIAEERIIETCREEIETLDIRDLETRGAIRKIRRIRPDLVVALGTKALEAVGAMENPPVTIYSMVHNTDPILGKKNVTGISISIAPDRQLELFKKHVPNLKRIGLVYTESRSGRFVEQAKKFAGAYGIELLTRKITRAQESMPAFVSLMEDIDAFWMVPDRDVYYPEMIAELFLLSFNNRLPLLTFSPTLREFGAILSVEVDYAEVGNRTGEMINTVIAGENTDRIPPQIAQYQVEFNQLVAEKMRIPMNVSNVAHSGSVSP